MNSDVFVGDLEKKYLKIITDYGIKIEEIEKVKEQNKNVNDKKRAELGKELIDLILSKETLVIEKAKDLISKGADVNYKSEPKGDFPLLICARKGYDEMAALLINSGADVNLANNYGTTALMAAARHDNAKLCIVLIRLGADVNASCKDGDTALFSAKMHGNDDCVKLLVQHNACLYHKNEKGESVLDVRGSATVIKKYIPKEETIAEVTHEDAMKLIEEASKELPEIDKYAQIPVSQPSTKVEDGDSEETQEEETVFGCTREEFEKLYEENNGFNTTYPADPPVSKHQQDGGKQRIRKKAAIAVKKMKNEKNKSSQVNITEESRRICAEALTRLD